MSTILSMHISLQGILIWIYTCVIKPYNEATRICGKNVDTMGASDFVGTSLWNNGPLARYVNLRFAHAPGMPGTFSPPHRVSDPDMHHGTCVMHVPWSMSGSLTSGFLWSRWREKRSRHSRRMRNPQFYVSDKRPMALSMQDNWVWVFVDEVLRGRVCPIWSGTN